jgi:hypothetical protein
MNRISRLFFFRDQYSKKSSLEICILNLILVLYIFRSSVPSFKYPFVLLFFGFFVYSLFIYKESVILSLRQLVKDFYVVFIPVFFVLLAALLSNKLYLNVFKEIIEISILLSLFFILKLVITSKPKLDFFVSNLLFIILIFSVLIALINTFVFIELQKYYGYYPINNYEEKYFLNSLLLDKNFAILPVLFGFIILLYKLNKDIHITELLGYNLIILFFSAHIILSSSRRGLIFLFIILFFLFSLRIILYINKRLILKRLILNLAPFFLTIFIISLSSLIFVYYGSYNFKINTLKCIGVKDISTTKRIITSTFYGPVSRFNKDLSYNNFNKVLWSTTYDPKDPDNGWGFGYYKTVFPLIGNNSEIVPKGSIGLKLDRYCTFGHSDRHAYYNEVLGKKEVNDKDVVKSYIYCCVSNDFNGDIVCLRSDGSTFGDRVSLYNLNLKGSWQKLTISANCKDGVAPVSLYFNKIGVTSFFSLTGYILFAYPHIEVVTMSDTILSGDNLVLDNQNIGHIGDKNKYNLYIANYIQKNETVALQQKSDSSVSVYTFETPGSGICASGFSLSYFPFTRINAIINSISSIAINDTTIIDNDSFRNWILNLIHEDTSYFRTKTILKVDTVSMLFVDDRLSRWQFALQIYSKEYTLKEKIFGGGFKFLNWYGYFFLNNKTKTDYPHNPFLHILLYSGIIGLIFYFFLLYKVVYYYIKFLNGYYLLFIFFLITYFFAFFSGGNPFDPPIMGFFVILPFLINSVYKKDAIGNVKSELLNG